MDFINNVDDIMDMVTSHFVNTAAYLPHTLDELIDALYNDYKSYGEWSDIKKNHTFEFVELDIDDEDYKESVKNSGIYDIIHLARKYRGPRGTPEIFYEFKIEDLVKYYDGDYAKTYLALHDIFSTWLA